MKGGISVCIFDKDMSMFRIIYTKGKAISTFGVSWTTTKQRQQQASTVDHGANNGAVADNNSDSSNIKQIGTTSEFLFMEEALFLHERGLLHVYDEKMQHYHLNKEIKGRPVVGMEKNEPKPLDTKELYEIMLHQLDMPLQVYLTYSHLRSQTYIVVRHTKDRLSIIRSMMEDNRSNKETMIQESGYNSESMNITDKKSKKRKISEKLKLDLRHDSFHAPLPHVFGINNSSNSFNSKDANEEIAFDVYKPNSNYRKTNPDQPDFYVTISNFAQPSPPFVKIKGLIETCNGIPLRMSSVADGGTVIMFSLTDCGVPDLTSTKKD